MSIQFNSETRTLTLMTQNTTYQMQVSPLGHLLHLYYGRKTAGDCLAYQYMPCDCGFSPNSYPMRHDRTFSLDLLPQEYSGFNTGDFRLSCLEVSDGSGAYGADFYYVSHEIRPGKYAIEGMPSVFDRDGEAETLVVKLADPVNGLELRLFYGVFAAQDVITRAAQLINNGSSPMRLEKAASVCLDLPFGEWDLIHFHGRHTMERQVERVRLNQAIQTVSSKRGASSHHHNPFVILCEPSATEEQGSCYGLMLVYSGNHRTDIEVDQMGTVRAVMGIHDEQFSWPLAPGEHFDTPEVILTYTHQGLTKLSHIYHNIIRNNIIRSKYGLARRPVLINNWEATYFQFDTEKIVGIARQAAELGVEMLVLDDGWFGKRDDDNSGLGDWFVNEKKLPGGLAPLIRQINDMGMKFGLWVEPEMVSEDSDLYRAHPNWALTLPGRKPTMGRNQLVLDMSREEVVDYLYERLSSLLKEHNIAYIKWDVNRNLTDVYSHAMPPERQGEVFHRYMLGVYALLERLTSEFPDVLFEGCSGGGGRFDAAMMAYFPQIWCSDDTDAIERLSIQYGTSFGYPISVVGSHVSACPNHQTGRTTPLDTRAVVAMSGTFGYELDLNKLTGEEKEQVRQQIRLFRNYYELIQYGSYYRLTSPAENNYFVAWQFVAPDQSETLVNLVVIHSKANPNPIHFRLRGLDPEAKYMVQETHYNACHVPQDMIHIREKTGGEASIYSGSALMYAGYSLPLIFGDYPSVQLHFVEVN